MFKNLVIPDEQVKAREFLKSLDDGEGDIGNVPRTYHEYILMLATPEQLDQIERYSMIKVDTEKHWKRLCENKFNMKEPTLDTWRDSYFDELQSQKKKTQDFKRRMLTIESKEKEEKASTATHVIVPKSVGGAGTAAFARGGAVSSVGAVSSGGGAPKAKARAAGAGGGAGGRAGASGKDLNKNPASGGISKSSGTRHRTLGSRSGGGMNAIKKSLSTLKSSGKRRS